MDGTREHHVKKRCQTQKIKGQMFFLLCGNQREKRGEKGSHENRREINRTDEEDQWERGGGKKGEVVGN